MAEDIVQNLFVQLWESSKLENVEKVEHFLLRATKYKCIDFLRTHKSSNVVSLDKLEDVLTASPVELAEEDVEPLLHYFASKLPPKTREVFLLSRHSNLTYKEIAAEMNISVKTVENQMGRALRKMKELLANENYLALLLFIILKNN